VLVADADACVSKVDPPERLMKALQVVSMSTSAGSAAASRVEQERALGS
jgi:hypothetical protein